MGVLLDPETVCNVILFVFSWLRQVEHQLWRLLARLGELPPNRQLSMELVEIRIVW